MGPQVGTLGCPGVLPAAAARAAYGQSVPRGRFPGPARPWPPVGDFRQNPIDVLHHFPLLEEIDALDAHGFTDQLEEVDDLERGCRFMGTQLAMASMINSDETVDAGGRRRVELPRMEFALIRRYRRERVAHVADSRLTEIDQFHARDRRKNLCDAFGHAGDARMLVQSDRAC